MFPEIVQLGQRVEIGCPESPGQGTGLRAMDKAKRYTHITQSPQWRKRAIKIRSYAEDVLRILPLSIRVAITSQCPQLPLHTESAVAAAIINAPEPERSGVPRVAYV